MRCLLMSLASLATSQQRSVEAQYHRSSSPCGEYLRPERLPVTEKHALFGIELYRRRREELLEYSTTSEPSAVPEGPFPRRQVVPRIGPGNAGDVGNCFASRYHRNMLFLLIPLCSSMLSNLSMQQVSAQKYRNPCCSACSAQNVILSASLMLPSSWCVR